MTTTEKFEISNANAGIKSLAKEKLLETLYEKYGTIITSKELTEIFNCTRSDLSFIPESVLPVIKGRGQGASKYLLDHVVSHIVGEPCYTVEPALIFDRLFPHYGVVLKTKEALEIFKVSRQELATVPESELPIATHIGRGVKRFMLSDIANYIVYKMCANLDDKPKPAAQMETQTEFQLVGAAQ